MNSSHSEEMMNKEYRHGLINAQIEVDLPLQIRALRKQLVGTQPDLAKLTGMKQPRISAMEKPGGAHFNLETLRRLAEAFDVALVVRFAPFSELLDWSVNFNPDTFRIPTFDEEVQTERNGPAITAQQICGIEALATMQTEDAPQWPAHRKVANQVTALCAKRLTATTAQVQTEISKTTLSDEWLQMFRKGPQLAEKAEHYHLPSSTEVTVSEMVSRTAPAFAGNQ